MSFTIQRQNTFARSTATARHEYEGAFLVIILLALLVVLMVAGLSFAVHLLWILAVVFLALWVVGLAMGRGERAGQHRFYKW